MAHCLITWATNLPYLGTIWLGNNQLTGPLPEAWGSNAASSYLGNVELQNNRLTGPLPASWSNLTLTNLRLDRNCLSGPVPCSWWGSKWSRMSSLYLCYNPVSAEVCGTNAGSLSGCLSSRSSAVSSTARMRCYNSPDVDPKNPPPGSAVDWHTGTDVAGFCGVESYAAAPALSTVAGQCFQQSNSPNDPYCSGAAPKPQTPVGVYNRGPSSGTLRTIANSSCAGADVGFYSATCGVDERGREVMTFNMTTISRADKTSVGWYWTGCKPPKSAPQTNSTVSTKSIGSAGSKQGGSRLATASQQRKTRNSRAVGSTSTPRDPTRPCNEWRVVPQTAQKVVGPTYTSTLWTLTFSKYGQNTPPGGCTCDSVYWSMYSKPGPQCGARA